MDTNKGQAALQAWMQRVDTRTAVVALNTLLIVFEIVNGVMVGTHHVLSLTDVAQVRESLR